jgi:rubrerythrin
VVRLCLISDEREGFVGAITEKQEKLLALFKLAIDSEREAQERYRGMLSLCDDAAICPIIEELIGEEMRHEDRLIDMYNDLRKIEEFTK